MKLGVIIVCALLSTLVEAKVHVLTVDNLVELGLKNSPDIDSRKFDFEAAQQRSISARGFYLPRLDLGMNGGKQWTKLKNLPQSNIDILTGSLGASQLLYDFGKTAGKVSGSENEAYALESQMQQSISDKILEVKQGYYEVLKSKSIIDVQKKNLVLQKQQLNRAQKYLDAGIKTIIDVSDAEVQVAQANLDLQNAKYEVELQRAKLEESLGLVPYEGDYVAYSKALNLKNISKTLPPMRSSLKQLIEYAYTHRYALESSTFYVKSANSNVETSKGEYYPTLSLEGNYAVQDVDEQALSVTPERQGQLAVNLSWNIFSGYQTDASVQEAKIAVLKAASQVQSVQLTIKREVHESHILVRQSKDNVILTESISKASFKKFEQAQKRYENELSDYVELQDAQQGYIQSLSNVVTAYYDYFIAMANLDHAVGK